MSDHNSFEAENCLREVAALAPPIDPEFNLDDEVEIEPAILSDSSICQQSVRSIVAGADCLSVTARVTIPAGADRHVLHVPVQPAFDLVPEVDAFVISGSELRIRITHREKFGLRLELILAKVSTVPTESIIEVISRSAHQEVNLCPPRREAA